MSVYLYEVFLENNYSYLYLSEKLLQYIKKVLKNIFRINYPWSILANLTSFPKMET